MADSALSQGTQRAIASAHLFASIIKDHFDHNSCVCDCETRATGPQPLNACTILSNIFIMGGAPRDYLLGFEINDLDILVDTQTLNQLYFEHLQAYHSSQTQQLTNKNCLFWKLYLRKFQEKVHTLYANQVQQTLPKNSRIKSGYLVHQANGDDDDHKNEPLDFKGVRNVLDCDYILNSKYFTDLISQSERLKDFIQVKIYNKHLFRLNEIKIERAYLYHSIDLNGQSIDFLDAVKRDANMDIIQKYELTEFIELFPQKYLYSVHFNHRHAHIKRCHQLGTTAPLAGSIQIQPLTYDTSAMEAILKADLSLNTLWIDLWNVCVSSDADTAIDFNWCAKIENCRLLQGYDAKKDFENKIITHPYLDQTVLIQRPKYHFFRVIKMFIKLGSDWTIDQRLVAATKKYFHLWIGNEDFWDDDNPDGYHFVLWNLFHRNGYSPQNKQQLQLMFNAFDVFGMNKILIHRLDQVDGFEWHFQESLKNNSIFSDKQALIDAYRHQGYPVDD
mmetsp:Transcript_26068/g.42609  ORF Transcript_26068/g.42609 Transcript_26068/m.42609 type:complete len:503 (-) Transcript_26068:63-1571(-)